MLVLSRRADQEIVFPQLGITVSVLRVKGKLVKIGIAAPQSVDVVRAEVVRGHSGHSGHSDTSQATGHHEHKLRNELNLLQLRMQALQRRLDRGESIDTRESLDPLLDQLSSIDHGLHPADAVQSTISGQRPKRLLVVEDCENERRLMAYVLASHGFDVEVARDGIEAIERLNLLNERPDCVLMDMNMPQSDGLETLMQIRSSKSLMDLRVFAVTGMSRDAETEPLSHGWDGWFQKPVDVGALIESLNCPNQGFVAA